MNVCKNGTRDFLHVHSDPDTRINCTFVQLTWNMLNLTIFLNITDSMFYTLPVIENVTEAKLEFTQKSLPIKFCCV